jgi:hypothetical protein
LHQSIVIPGSTESIDPAQENSMTTQKDTADRSDPGRAATIAARLDRLDVWCLSYLFIGIIGVGFLFTFYDIFDINVSWIQSCVQFARALHTRQLRPDAEDRPAPQPSRIRRRDGRSQPDRGPDRA